MLRQGEHFIAGGGHADYLQTGNYLQERSHTCAEKR
jgi:hypothetical protein